MMMAVGVQRALHRWRHARRALWTVRVVGRATPIACRPYSHCGHRPPSGSCWPRKNEPATACVLLNNKDAWNGVPTRNRGSFRRKRFATDDFVGQTAVHGAPMFVLQKVTLPLMKPGLALSMSRPATALIALRPGAEASRGSLSLTIYHAAGARQYLC